MRRLSVMLLTGCLFILGMLAGSTVLAKEWSPNSPDTIQIVDGQKEYTMKWGDTLWAIGQKVNIKHEKLAEVNGIDLKSGEQYTLPIGRVLMFSKGVVTVKDADGSIYSQSVINEKDKINQEKEIGEASEQEVSSYPYAVTRESLSYPLAFYFNGINMPDSVTLDFTYGNSGKVTFLMGEQTYEYNATFNTISTKLIRIYSANSTSGNKIRTVNVNTEIALQPVAEDTYFFGGNNSNKLYLFVNNNGGLSLITSNYAGNYPIEEADVMAEVLQGNTATVPTPLAGYSEEQIEYARVTEALLQYYGITGQPIEVSVTKNAAGAQVLPFNGSQTLTEPSFQLSFSMDGTMASTVIVTYLSNHNGSIRFYKIPNHYQDPRYESDPDWVSQETGNLLNNIQTLSIPNAYDQQAAEIIDLISIR
ncbi:MULTISPECIES: LysM peptidoglycan-binding domain-containing protein [unclassified Enterococcus]|uniref:LysM peptidoglycan-binding domain-containing protein n=1 Tax=unclassified Enterococcus TaxID=2608891 RepID=UPI001E55A84C|nr:MULTISPECIES: LysM peptidoglycan-binding domain-containing protein [unclassified Enterococcus]MCB5955292.1 LysM peptidoglycan-binding domain-containing protein [Enterococcus sp. CWB-B31]